MTTPPNASLAFEQDGAERVRAVTLTNPVVDGDALTFSYTPLATGAPVVVGARTAELPAEFQSAALFIDASNSTLGRSIGLGHQEEPQLAINSQYIYPCTPGSSATCWGFLDGWNLEAGNEWEVFYTGSDSPVVSGTVPVGGEMDQVELTLPCPTDTATVYASDRDDEVSTVSFPQDAPC